jgi:hypothetical protein
LGFGIIGPPGAGFGALTPGVPAGGVDCAEVGGGVVVGGACVDSDPQADTATVSRNSVLAAMCFVRI